MDQSTHSIKVSDNDKEAIEQILFNETYPRTVKEIRGKLKHTGRVLPEYLITRTLRSLLSDGRLRFKAGRWMSNELYDQTQEIQTGFFTRNIERPSLSSTSENILTTQGSKSDEGTNTRPTETPGIISNRRRGPWGTFKNLLSYYSECLRNEESADASAYVEEIGKRYLYANGIGNWFPKTGKSWRNVIPLGPHVTDFVQNLSRNAVDNIVVFGYPIEAVVIKRTGEPDTRLIRPIFQYILDAKFTQNSITLSTNEAQPEISLEWMKYGLKGYSEQYHFLSSCGLINQERPEDEPQGFTADDIRPDLDELTNTLSSFLSKRVREPLNCRSVSAHSLPAEFRSGIYNRAVIMIGKRTKYTQTLLKELKHIESQSDEILDQTSLKHIFKIDSTEAINENEEKPHEAIVADVMPLNAEQREAVSSLLTKEISVVTGPPGTGKSQVVMETVANSLIQRQSVLFASRNHKAIDAVVDRLKDSENRPLIIRTNSKSDPNLNYTFKKAIKDLLTANGNVEVLKKYEKKVDQLNRLLADRGQNVTIINRIYFLGDKIGELEEKLSELKADLPDKVYETLLVKNNLFEQSKIKSFGYLLERINKITESQLGQWNLKRVIIWVQTIPLWWNLNSVLNVLGLSSQIPPFPPFKKHKISDIDTGLFTAIIECIIALHKLSPLEEDLKQMSAHEILINAIKGSNEKIQELSSELLTLNVSSRIGVDPDSDDRSVISPLDSAIRNLDHGFTDEHLRVEAQEKLIKYTPTLLKYFPCWAVTNLSAGSRIPLAPGVFNLSIIDEASQCDIASAIPILYRSKRTAVVGDPNQLKHVSKLSPGKDVLLRKRSHLTALEDIRFSYRDKSLYDLFSQTSTVSPHLLRETYRSCSEIAEYSNQVFYNGMLRVATDHKNLNKPTGMKIGLHWTAVEGQVESAGRSGCVCEEEIEAVYKIISKILVTNKFRGTLGVVTPFRQQQKRLHDRIYDSDIPYELLNQSKIVIDTAHGFQGDEKDVMIFSLCAGPNMPKGSLFFIRNSANLFNVAVSRARAVLHVVGNRGWANECGIDHIGQLAKSKERKSTIPSTGPWSPHDSPWEKILYEALLAKGIETIPQYPVSGRRLDLGLVDKERDLKIDIEVDSDKYHRNPDGSRKMGDTWRDIFLIDQGWKIMRFWVYNLKEDMQKCVSEIDNAWRNNE